MPARRRWTGWAAGAAIGLGLASLAGCAAAPDFDRAGCLRRAADSTVAARAELAAALDAVAGAAIAANDWADANADLAAAVPDLAATRADADALAAGAAAARADLDGDGMAPLLHAASCGATDRYPMPAGLRAGELALAGTRADAARAVADVRADLAALDARWADERRRQLAIAAGYTDSPTPIVFDVVRADDAHFDATLKAHHPAAKEDIDYVAMRWSMGGRTFPGVGGLVRFTGGIQGLYRVTELLGQLDKADRSTYAPYDAAVEGLRHGAYDATFQTSWGGQESSIRIWALIRVAA